MPELESQGHLSAIFTREHEVKTFPTSYPLVQPNLLPITRGTRKCLQLLIIFMPTKEGTPSWALKIRGCPTMVATCDSQVTVPSLSMMMSGVAEL